MIAAVLEASGLPVEKQDPARPDQHRARGDPRRTDRPLSRIHRQRRALLPRARADPAWKNADAGLCRGEAARPRRKPSRLADAGARQQHLGHRDPQRSAGAPSRASASTTSPRYLAAGGRFKLAASAEFVESPAALPAFEATYGFHLRADQLLTLSGGNTAATLRAAAEGISGVNAAMAYGTDGELAALGLTALCDDKGAQIVYAPAPVVREAVLDQHPEIAAALDPGIRLAVADHPASAERADRGRRRRCRRRRIGLSEIAAFPAVTCRHCERSGVISIG